MTDAPLIPEFQIAKLQLAPGDVLVVKCAHVVSDETARRVKDLARRVLPVGVKVMVIDPNCDLTKLTRTEIEQRSAAA